MHPIAEILQTHYGAWPLNTPTFILRNYFMRVNNLVIIMKLKYFHYKRNELRLIRNRCHDIIKRMMIVES